MQNTESGQVPTFDEARDWSHPPTTLRTYSTASLCVTLNAMRHSNIEPMTQGQDPGTKAYRSYAVLSQSERINILMSFCCRLAGPEEPRRGT